MNIALRIFFFGYVVERRDIIVGIIPLPETNSKWLTIEHTGKTRAARFTTHASNETRQSDCLCQGNKRQRRLILEFPLVYFLF